jgi:hypothetical protein
MIFYLLFGKAVLERYTKVCEDCGSWSKRWTAK